MRVALLERLVEYNASLSKITALLLIWSNHAVGGAHGCPCCRRTSYNAALKWSPCPGQRYERDVLAGPLRYVFFLILRVRFQVWR